MADEIIQIRDYISLLEGFIPFDEEVDPEETETVSVPEVHPIIAELTEAVFKMKSFMESEDGDYALGVETGMQRASEIIENIIARHSIKDE